MSCHIISFSVFAGESANQLIHSFHFISKQQQQFTFLHCLLLTYLCTTGFWFVFPVNCVCVCNAPVSFSLSAFLCMLCCVYVCWVFHHLKCFLTGAKYIMSMLSVPLLFPLRVFFCSLSMYILHYVHFTVAFCFF